MDIRNSRSIKNTATEALAAAPGNPKKLALVYLGGITGLSLLLTLGDYLIGTQMANTGGLANLGLRSILQTGREVLPIVQMFLLLCLEYGYVSVVLGFARKQETSPQTLLNGFYRFGPVFRFTLLQTLVYSLIGILAVWVGFQVFLITPFSRPLYELLEPMISGGVVDESAMMAMDPALATTIAESCIPLLVIVALIYFVVLVPVFYSFRMARFVLMDEPRQGAWASMVDSLNLMKKNRFNLFKLDLSFWWYYLLQMLATALCYGDLLLPMVGIMLPWSEEFSYFLFYAAYLLCQFVLCYFALNKVEVTYAVTYEILRQPPEVPVFPAPTE